MRIFVCEQVDELTLGASGKNVLVSTPFGASFAHGQSTRSKQKLPPVCLKLLCFGNGGAMIWKRRH